MRFAQACDVHNPRFRGELSMLLRRIARRIKREITKPRYRWGDFDKLHLGCGDNRFPGWLNVGIPGDVRHDLTKPLPLPNGSVRFIFSEHFIEHITRTDALALFRECRRVLTGAMRISTPDLTNLVAEYSAGRVSGYTDAYWQPQTPCQMVNECHRLWGHQFIYDFTELSALLREAGFTEVCRANWRESEFSELRNLERREFHGDLIVEAR
jgi:predicted SAM-dependent methyltransferase